MFGRTVTIDGKQWLVMCSPNTALSEVLRRAAEMVWREEDAARRAGLDNQAYQRALENSR